MTKHEKKSSEKNNSRMQCSIFGVLPNNSKLLERNLSPQGKAKVLFCFSMLLFGIRMYIILSDEPLDVEC